MNYFCIEPFFHAFPNFLYRFKVGKFRHTRWLRERGYRKILEKIIKSAAKSNYEIRRHTSSGVYVDAKSSNHFFLLKYMQIFI